MNNEMNRIEQFNAMLRDIDQKIREGESDLRMIAESLQKYTYYAENAGALRFLTERRLTPKKYVQWRNAIIAVNNRCQESIQTDSFGDAHHLNYICEVEFEMTFSAIKKDPKKRAEIEYGANHTPTFMDLVSKIQNNAESEKEKKMNTTEKNCICEQMITPEAYEALRECAQNSDFENQCVFYGFDFLQRVAVCQVWKQLKECTKSLPDKPAITIYDACALVDWLGEEIAFYTPTYDDVTKDEILRTAFLTLWYGGLNLLLPKRMDKNEISHTLHQIKKKKQQGIEGIAAQYVLVDKSISIEQFLDMLDIFEELNYSGPYENELFSTVLEPLGICFGHSVSDEEWQTACQVLLDLKRISGEYPEFVAYAFSNNRSPKAVVEAFRLCKNGGFESKLSEEQFANLFEEIVDEMDNSLDDLTEEEWLAVFHEKLQETGMMN